MTRQTQQFTSFFSCLTFSLLSIPALHAQAPIADISIPYVSQVPDGNWVSPWDQACEEASISMVDGFYAKKTQFSTEESKQTMQTMIDWENAAWKKNDDTTAKETAELIKTHASFTSTIKRNPSLQDIKDELDEQHPVIALVNMYALYQEPASGDSYHVLVITGYDEAKQEFIVQDPARKEATRRAYSTLMQSLHDFNPTSKEADGVPTVLFTGPHTSSGISQFFQWISLVFKRLFSTTSL